MLEYVHERVCVYELTFFVCILLVNNKNLQFSFRTEIYKFYLSFNVPFNIS